MTVPVWYKWNWQIQLLSANGYFNSKAIRSPGNPKWNSLSRNFHHNQWPGWGDVETSWFLRGNKCMCESPFKEAFFMLWWFRLYTLCDATGSVCFQWVEYRKLDNAHGVCWSCVLCGMAASILGPADQRGRAQDGCGKRLFHHHHKVGCGAHAATDIFLSVSSLQLSTSVVQPHRPTSSQDCFGLSLVMQHPTSP